MRSSGSISRPAPTPMWSARSPTGRFFPEDDDTHRDLSGENRKANELLGRRLAVEDAAEAHLAALERAPALGFDTFILAAPTPFARADAEALIEDAPAVIAHYFP